MALKFVVGLFESKGIAEDAVNRLKYEGVPATNVFVLVMHETTAGVPAAMTPELAALEVDPFVVGNVRETYAPFIHKRRDSRVRARAHGRGSRCCGRSEERRVGKGCRARWW